MATYAIGDLQGCFDELMDLLNEINFDERNDQLWFAGDLINRGPKSLQCLEFVFDRKDNVNTVLGNHDLHLLAIYEHVRQPHSSDTFDEILRSNNIKELVTWYRKQPFILHSEEFDYFLVHAGIPPQWSMSRSLDLANEVSQVLQTDQYFEFIQVMYGNKPDSWNEGLSGFDRVRYIINCFTRIRYCDQQGKLNLKENAEPGKQTAELVPWYAYPGRISKGQKILFGHWSTVTLGSEQDFRKFNAYPLDTGCLWGGTLTAMRLEDAHWFSVPSRQSKSKI